MSKAQDYLKKLENGNTSSTPSSTTEKLSTSGYLRNLEKENMNPQNVRARERAVKIAGFTAQESARLAEESKFNLKRDVGGVLRNLPGAMKQVGTQAITHPISTAKAIVTGAADVGPAVVNLGGSILGIDKKLPSLSKAFTETLPKNQQDVSQAISEGTKMVSGYELGGAGVGKLGVKGPIVKSVLGNVAGGQIVTDEGTLKGRTQQAAFDAAFGLVTGGAGKLIKGAKGKQVVPEVAPVIPEVPPVPPAPPGTGVSPISRVLGRGEVPPVEPGTIKISQVIENLKKTNVTARQGEAILKELSQNNPTGNFTKAEIVKAFQNNIPPSTKGIFKNIRTETPAAKVEPTPVVPIKETPILQEGIPSGAKVSGEGKGTGVGTGEAKGGPSSEIPAFEASTEVAQKAQADAYLSAGKEDHVLAVAQGRVSDPSLNKSAAFKVLEEKYAGGVKAGEAGALEKLNELSKSGVISQAGQDLSFTGMGLGSEGPASLLSLARKIKEEAITKGGRNIGKETETAFTEVSRKIEKGVDINKALSDFIDKITC